MWILQRSRRLRASSLASLETKRSCKLAARVLVLALLVSTAFARLDAQVVLNQPSAVIIAGVVRDRAAQPVPGASVTLTGAALDGAPRVTTTNAEGHFSFTVPSGGVYSVRVARIGSAAQRADLTAAPGTAVIVDVELGGESTIRVADAPTLPLVQPFADAQNWVLHTPMTYKVFGTEDMVVVPAGFVTDFASIPKKLQSFASINGPWTVAGIIHDYLYWEQGPTGCTRDEADGIFRLVMLENKATAFEANAMHWALEMAGGAAFNSNATDRANGLPRVLPPAFRTIKPLTKWPAYRATVKAAGVGPGPKATISRAFCAHGTRDPKDVLGRRSP